MPIRASDIYQYLKLVTCIAVLVVVFLAIAVTPPRRGIPK
jgi:hypothetical protein